MDRPETAKIRLYVEHPLGEGQSVRLDRAQAHYLFGVMRLGVGGRVALFDGKNGGWVSEVEAVGKRDGVLRVAEQCQPQKNPPDVWLLFAPVKKARTDFIVEKAVEMGVARLQPVQTDYTNSGRIQRDRLQATAVEAAEQCGATYVPEVAEMARLASVLDRLPSERRLMFCDEAAVRAPLDGAPGPWAVLIGPEGGFSPAERARLTDLPQS
ncbi:MAG: 16S rRNA (uracil(1498)-N(3))-methyltransferase, partial [Pseudomonadota bacterium]